MAFVFYDTETTGIHVHFDQILQFAAILTDNNLVEIERFDIRSRLSPNTVASPGAMSVTGITAKQLQHADLPSQYEMICKIQEKLLEWQPAQFVGHNSLRFDEVLLRSALYKNLLPPYLTNTNGNSRLDTFIMVQSAHLYEHDAITIPTGQNGKPSFKLDKLAPANGFNHANAHEAMSDVEATIYMCKLIRDNAPDTWSRTMRFAQKQNAIDFCDNEEVFGLTEFYFGRPYTFLLHQLGRNPHDPNEIIAFDLSIEPDEITQYSDRELVERMSNSPKPIRRFRANGLPMLLDADEAFPNIKASGVTLEGIEDRAERLIDDKVLTSRFLSAYLQSKPQYDDDSPHVEENIYSGFANAKDSALMEQFHVEAWSKRYDIVCEFDDPRYRELGEQLIYFESPEHLSTEVRRKWSTKIADRLLGSGEPCNALTLQDAIQQADDLIANMEGAKKTLLEEHQEKLNADLISARQL